MTSKPHPWTLAVEKNALGTPSRGEEHVSATALGRACGFRLRTQSTNPRCDANTLIFASATLLEKSFGMRQRIS